MYDNQRFINFANCQMPKKFDTIQDVLKWAPVHMDAISFRNLETLHQHTEIVKILAILRNFTSVRWDGSCIVPLGQSSKITGLRIIKEKNSLVLQSVRGMPNEPHFESFI